MRAALALALLWHAAAATVVEDFRRDGFAVVQGFASAEEVAAMKAAMQEKTDAYWAERSDPTVFRTDAGQEAAQARSRKFFESRAEPDSSAVTPDAGSSTCASSSTVGAAAYSPATPPPATRTRNCVSCVACIRWTRFNESAHKKEGLQGIFILAAEVNHAVHPV